MSKQQMNDNIARFNTALHNWQESDTTRETQLKDRLRSLMSELEAREQRLNHENRRIITLLEQLNERDEELSRLRKQLIVERMQKGASQ